MNTKINYLFPNHFYIKESIGRTPVLNDEETNFVKNIQNNMASSNLKLANPVMHSNNKNILQDNAMRELHNIILQKLNFVSREILNFRPNLDIMITQSWLVLGKKGQMAHGHIHSNSILSGVFYIKTDKNDTLTFMNSGSFNLQPNFIVLDFFDKTKPLKNAIFRRFERVNVEEGSLLIFPSHLMHQIEEIKTNETRISIAFNTFVKGTLGSKEEATELII